MTTLLTLRMSRTLSFSKQGSNEPSSRRVVQRLGKITKQITKKTDYLSDRDDKKVDMRKLKTFFNRKTESWQILKRKKEKIVLGIRVARHSFSFHDTNLQVPSER